MGNVEEWHQMFQKSFLWLKDARRRQLNQNNDRIGIQLEKYHIGAIVEKVLITRVMFQIYHIQLKDITIEQLGH